MSDSDSFWACTIHDLPGCEGPAQATGNGLTDVVGQLNFAKPVSLAELAALELSCAWCFEKHRVALARVLLARDGKRAILIFRAPDAESVRLACRHAQIPIERVWPQG